MKFTSGQSIVETVIAAGLISVGMLAALSLTTRTVRQNDYAKNLGIATKYASQVADYFRGERASYGWNTLATKVSSDAVNNLAVYCFNTIPESPLSFADLVVGECSDNTYIPDQSADGNSIFTREAILDSTDVASGTLRLTVTVTWGDTTPRQVQIEQELTSWQ